MEQRNNTPRVTRAALALAILGATSLGAPAQQLSLAAPTTPALAATLPAADLEKLFWACDFAATRWHGNGPSLTLCQTAYERLKEEKFGGDFERLLGWWRTNKVAEHRRFDAEDYGDGP